jgi:hypothetical protein
MLTFYSPLSISADNNGIMPQMKLLLSTFLPIHDSIIITFVATECKDLRGTLHGRQTKKLITTLTPDHVTLQQKPSCDKKI